ncbi:MAG: NUDIX hydrolase [Spirochaetota bacterium]
MVEIQRKYPTSPIIGVGAAVFKEDEVLLVRRGKPPLYGRWSLPGGVVHPDEDMKSALKREIKEECGIDVEVYDLIDIFEYIEQDKDKRVRYHYIVFDFRAEQSGGILKPASDVLEVRWVSLSRLEEYELTDKVIEVINKGIR